MKRDELLLFFTAEAIANSITEFKYCPEDIITIPSYFRKKADIFKRECEKLTDKKTARLLLKKIRPRQK